MTLTPEQEAIVAGATGQVSRIVAYAGTGKTHTLLAYAERHIRRMLYLAFNTSVQLEASQRFKPMPHVQCRTIHSLAFQAVRPANKVQPYLSFLEIRRLLGCSMEHAVNVSDTLEAYMRSAEQQITSDICPFRYESDDDAEIRIAVATSAREVYAAMRKNTFPYPHGFYLKEYQLSNPMLRTDIVMLDEAQDTSPVMLDILLRQACRIICVGDPYQQIYGFTGAVDAMDKIKGNNFYLTQSFRFGQSLADAASLFLGAFYDLPKPLVGLPNIQTQLSVGDVQMEFPYTHIFRTNAGLFEEAINCVARKRKIAFTGGRRVDDFLIDLQNMWFVYANQPEQCSNPLYKAFGSWAGLAAWAASRDDTGLTSKMSIVEKHGGRLPAVIALVRANVVPDEEADVLLVTAHRAKGMQWDRVYVADDFMLLTDESGQPLKLVKHKVRKDAIFTEVDSNEAHLVYVAMTRAIKHLRVCKTYVDLLQARPNEALKRIREARQAERSLAVPAFMLSDGEVERSGDEDED